jgi:hypothetical protein
MVSTTFNPINDIILAIVFVGGVVAYSRSRIPRQTIKDLQEHAKGQDLLIQDLRAAKEQLIKSLGILEGQVKTYKELPLRELAEGIKEVVNLTRENAESNKAILEQLKSTAEIAAEDRDMLTNQNKHKKTEVHKIIDEQVNKP